MSQESSATELEVAMLYSDVLAESDDENDVWLQRRAVMQLGSLQLWQLAAANGNCRWA